MCWAFQMWQTLWQRSVWGKPWHLHVHVYDKEPRGLGVADLPLGRGDTHLSLLGESSPHWRTYGLCSRLPLFTYNEATSIVLSKEEEGTLQLLNPVLRVSNKSNTPPRSCTLGRVRCKEKGDGGGTPVILRTGGLQQSLCLSLGHPPRKGKKLPFEPSYLGSHYARTSVSTIWRVISWN